MYFSTYFNRTFNSVEEFWDYAKEHIQQDYETDTTPEPTVDHFSLPDMDYDNTPKPVYDSMQIPKSYYDSGPVPNYYDLGLDYNPFEDYETMILISNVINALYSSISMPTSFIVSLLGLVANVINIIVFYRQGILADSCTPCLVGLAVSDFSSCLMSLIISCLDIVNGVGFHTDERYSGAHIGALRIFMRKPLPVFVQTTSWVTVHIAFERMMSVTFPFHVKMIFTPRRSCVIVMALFVATLVLHLTNFLNDKIKWVTNSNGNKEIRWADSGIIPDDVSGIVVFINEIVLRLACVFLVLVFNLIIIGKVNMSRVFRKTKASASRIKERNNLTDGRVTNKDAKSGKRTSVSNSESKKKEMKLIKMMVVLCIVFLITFLPQTFVWLTSTVKTISTWLNSVFGLFVISGGAVLLQDVICPFLELINSSVNIIIYSTMSSRYRKELKILCSFLIRKKGQRKPE